MGHIGAIVGVRIGALPGALVGAIIRALVGWGPYRGNSRDSDRGPYGEGYRGPMRVRRVLQPPYVFDIFDIVLRLSGVLLCVRASSGYFFAAHLLYIGHGKKKK